MGLRSVILIALCGSLMVPAVATAQRRTCTIRGEVELAHVRVQPSGREPFELALHGVPAALTARRRAQRASVRTTSGLLFEGTVPSADVPLAVAREVAVARGVVTLRAGTPIEGVSLGAQTVSVELAGGVRIGSLPVPCDALRVGPTAEASALPSDAPTRGTLLSRGESLRVHTRPGGASIVVEAAALRLAEQDRRPGWVRVRRDFAAGSTVAGWVREADVDRVAEEEFTETGGLFGMEGLGLCGSGSTHNYRGPATLLAGSDVRDARDGAVWARVEADLRLTRVRVPYGGDWAQILRIEGVHDHEGCEDELDRAWVPVTALRFPHGAGGVPASQVEPAPEEAAPDTSRSE